MERLQVPHLMVISFNLVSPQEPLRSETDPLVPACAGCSAPSSSITINWYLTSALYHVIYLSWK